jgi:hypothetical protein
MILELIDDFLAEYPLQQAQTKSIPLEPMKSLMRSRSVSQN